MAALTTRRSALSLIAMGTVISIATAESATQAKAATMSDIKQLCDRYYDAWGRKDLNAIVACVDSGVVFKSPNATTNGREAYAAAAQRFLGLVDHIEVRHTFFAPDSAMAAVDFYCIQPIGLCPTAERIAVKNGLIVEDELFFDVRPFEALARARAAAQRKQ